MKMKINAMKIIEVHDVINSVTYEQPWSSKRQIFNKMFEARTHIHTQPFNGCGPGQPGYAGNRRNTHPLTPILIIGHPLSNSSIYNDQWHPLCSFYVLEAGTGLK